MPLLQVKSRQEPIETAYRRLLRRRPASDLEVQSAQCPKCHAPLTVCLGRNGPYYHCRCLETRRPKLPEGL